MMSSFQQRLQGTHGEKKTFPEEKKQSEPVNMTQVLQLLENLK